MSDKASSSDFKRRLSDMRHYLCTPVGHIIGYAEMLEEYMGEGLSPGF
jgi:signal transduction histidine kinase